MPNTYNKILTKGPESILPSIEDGKLRFTTDTGRLFIDGDNTRTEITDFVKGLTEAEIKSQLAPLTNKIYIASDSNKMLYYNITNGWMNINSGNADYATNAGNANTVNGKTVLSNVPAYAVFTDTTDSAHISYSNITSGLNATKVQGAIDELSSEKKDEYTTITYAQWQQMSAEQRAEKDYYISDYPSAPIDAGNIDYDNTTSGLDSTDVQGSIDELSSEKKDEYTTITYAQWQQMSAEQRVEKDYYISDYPSSAITAGNISYSNTISGLDADNVQVAVDELKNGLTNLDVALSVPDGAGKNLLPLTVDGIKALNTNGTWNGNAYTFYGVTFTIQTDNNGNVVSISANGTTDSSIWASALSLPYLYIINGESYIITGCPSGGSARTYVLYTTNDGSNNVMDHGDGRSYSATFTGQAYVRIAIYKGATVNNIVFKPMIRYATITDQTFAPYIPSVDARLESVESELNILKNIIVTGHIPADGGYAEWNITGIDFTNRYPVAFYVYNDGEPYLVSQGVPGFAVGMNSVSHIPMIFLGSDASADWKNQDCFAIYAKVD